MRPIKEIDSDLEDERYDAGSTQSREDEGTDDDAGEEGHDDQVDEEDLIEDEDDEGEDDDEAEVDDYDEDEVEDYDEDKDEDEDNEEDGEQKKQKARERDVDRQQGRQVQNILSRKDMHKEHEAAAEISPKSINVGAEEKTDRNKSQPGSQLNTQEKNLQSTDGAGDKINKPFPNIQKAEKPKAKRGKQSQRQRHELGISENVKFDKKHLRGGERASSSTTIASRDERIGKESYRARRLKRSLPITQPATSQEISMPSEPRLERGQKRRRLLDLKGGNEALRGKGRKLHGGGQSMSDQRKVVDALMKPLCQYHRFVLLHLSSGVDGY